MSMVSPNRSRVEQKAVEGDKKYIRLSEAAHENEPRLAVL